MTIICQICNKNFEKLISSTHLKTHSISSVEYKLKFGKNSLASDEYRSSRSASLSGNNNPMFGKSHSDATKKQISSANTGNIAHNKGQKITDPVHLEKLRTAIKTRDTKYKETGYHPRLGAKLSDDTKSKISKSVANYAANNADELKSRSKKRIKTLIENNYDFRSPMLGKIHSVLTKSVIKEKSIEHGRLVREQTFEKNSKILENTSLSITNLNNNIMQITCDDCNSTFEFTTQYLNPSKFRIDLCPVCRKPVTKSKDELEILEFVKENTDELVLSGNRSTIYPLELDIYIPSLNLAIEYCGLYWHSELQGKDSSYHIHKLNECNKQNITLITIFEDEWTNKQEIVKSRIIQKLKKTDNIIYARKCIVSKIDNKIANEFVDVHHIQGKGQSAISYGLYHNSELVSVMTFSKPSISKGSISSDNVWELNRFCSKINTSVVGGASKLFSKFIRDYDPISIFSYSDSRWNTGNVYNTIGFVFDSHTPPSYWYFKLPIVKRIHRFSLRKNKLDDQSLTEWQNRISNGYNRIWDCGNTKWIWNKKGTI